MSGTLKRLRGLKDLLQDAVTQGSKAIEKVQVESAARPFSILEQIAPIAGPARGVHVVHDVVVKASHGMVRLWTGAVGATLDVVLDVVEGQHKPEPPKEEP